MKKILLIIILTLSIFFLFADPYSGSDLSGNASLTLSSNLTTIFRQGDSSGNTKHSLAVGYTLNNKTVTGETIIPIGDDYKLILSETYIGDKAKATGSIYAFFRVASLDGFNVTLSWNPLVNSSDSTKKIGLSINNKTSGSVFYAFDPSNGVMADDRVKLDLVTSDYVNKDSDYVNKDHVGTYSTTITMTISSGV